MMTDNEAARSVSEGKLGFVYLITSLSHYNHSTLDSFSVEELSYVLKDRLTTEEDTNSEVHSAFQLFDVDDKGYINVRDLRRVAAELGEDIKDDELQEMIEEASRSKKGQVSETDFTMVMKKTSLY